MKRSIFYKTAAFLLCFMVLAGCTTPSGQQATQSNVAPGIEVKAESEKTPSAKENKPTEKKVELQAAETVSAPTSASGSVPATAAAKPQEKADNTSGAKSYIANKNTKKFHYPNCRSVSQIKEKNKKVLSCTREEAIDKGYTPCKICIQ